jgi:hypothetical protein
MVKITFMGLLGSLDIIDKCGLYVRIYQVHSFIGRSRSTRLQHHYNLYETISNSYSETALHFS